MRWKQLTGGRGRPAQKGGRQQRTQAPDSTRPAGCVWIVGSAVLRRLGFRMCHAAGRHGSPELGRLFRGEVGTAGRAIVHALWLIRRRTGGKAIRSLDIAPWGPGLEV